MKPSLSGVRAKIERALEHLHAVELEIGTWSIADGYDVVTKFYPEAPDQRIQPQGSGYAPVLEVTDRTILDRIALVTGDCVHNLRSSLDHLAHQLVRVANNTPDGSTAFPVLDERMTDKGNVKTLSVSGGVTPDALALIEAAQPYQRGEDDPTLHPLWLVQNLDNIDKHRTLNVMAGMVAAPSVTLCFKGGAVLHQWQGIQAFKEGTPMAWFPVAGPPEDVEVNTRYTPFVALGDFGSVEGEPVDEVLRELADYVAQLIDCFRVRFFPWEEPIYEAPLPSIF